MSTIIIEQLTSIFRLFILRKMSNEKPKFLSVAEVAERLGLTRGRVNQLITDGVLPADRIGRAYMINENDLDKAENRNTQKTGRPPKEKK